jgi:subtilisin family serine protease
MIDPLSGHGTFIAGLVHQGCPDAKILSWRVVPSQGPIVESDWVKALSRIAKLVKLYREKKPGGVAIDVLSLSMGYYHETPDDKLFDSTLHDILEDLGRNGVIVVASAGNDATSRPSFPAAFTPWTDNQGPYQPDNDCVPVVSVGAKNPNGQTDALFSNAGPWVRVYVRGASLVSTMPAFQGGLQAVARTKAFGRDRESIDPDDFRGGFGVWSGTSFAAPFYAGRLASALVNQMEPEGVVLPKKDAVARAWKVVEEQAKIKP